MSSSQKSAVSTDQAPAAIGPYSQAVKLGNLVYTSGQIPLPPPSGAQAQNKALESGDIREQTRLVLHNLAAVLKGAGSDVARIVKTTVFVMDLGQFAALNEEYEAFFKEHGQGAPFPARSTVQVAGLPRGALVEIECVAHL